MLTVGEWCDKTEEICDSLEDMASKEKNKKINEANDYYGGYIQACEDYRRRMNQAISENQG